MTIEITIDSFSPEAGSPGVMIEVYVASGIPGAEEGELRSGGGMFTGNGVSYKTDEVLILDYSTYTSFSVQVPSEITVEGEYYFEIYLLPSGEQGESYVLQSITPFHMNKGGAGLVMISKVTPNTISKSELSNTPLSIWGTGFNLLDPERGIGLTPSPCTFMIVHRTNKLATILLRGSAESLDPQVYTLRGYTAAGGTSPSTARLAVTDET